MNWKFYNIKGEEVKDFEDRFYSFTCPVDGIYRAYERIKDSKNVFRVIYLDQNFEELFSGQRFWEATDLKGGYAFVQLKDQNGPWAILDSTNGNIKNLDSLLSKKVRNIKKDSKGYGIISYKDVSRKDYIDKNGNIINPKDDKIKLTKEQKKIEDNIQICINNHSYALSTGIGIDKPDFMLQNKSENKELSFGVVLNDRFIPDWMKLKKNEFFFCDVASDKFFGGLVLDTLKKENHYKYYDFTERKNILTTDKKIEYIYGNRFFVTTPSSTYGTNLIEILDPQGNIIYSLPPNKRLFVGIKSSQEFNDDEIFKLYLSKDEDLTSLKNYKELRHIEFDQFTFTQLPGEVSNLANLESLKISDCSKLKELPSWLGSARNLKKVEIADCVELKNLETIIEESTSLVLIKTQNYRFEKGFKKRIKELKPKLKFDSTYLRSK